MGPFVNIICLLSQLDQLFLTDPFIFFFQNEQCKFNNLQPEYLHRITVEPHRVGSRRN